MSCKLSWTLLLGLLIALPAAAEGPKPKPAKIELIQVLTNTKGWIDRKPYPITLRLFRGMVFEYISKVEESKKGLYRARYVNGETIMIKAPDARLVKAALPLPKEAKQKLIYKDWHSVIATADRRARARAQGSGEKEFKFFQIKYRRENMLSVIKKYALIHRNWEQIKANGEAKGWGEKKPKK